jgi:DNA-binding MurR/RpiR family transcriptional regulator
MAEPREMARPPARPLLSRLRAEIFALAPSDAKVAQYVLDAPQDVIFQSVSEVGLAAGTAASTVVRCAQQLGFKGFQDLKIALARELGTLQTPPREPTGAATSPAQILTDVTHVLADTVRGAALMVEPAQFAAVAEALGTTRRVLFSGAGTSAPLVQDAVFRFITIGVQAEVSTEIYTQQLSAHSLGAGDVFFAVSHTGSTRGTVTCALQAREAGAFTAALTSFGSSPLAEAVEHPLVARACAVPKEMEAPASRLAHIAVLDALLVAVSRSRPERTARYLELYGDIQAEHRF